MLRFEILDSDQGVNRFVELQTFPIRKLSASELHIDDASVSRLQARIEKMAIHIGL